MLDKLYLMPRPKLPEHKVKDTVGIKLSKDIIAELERIGRMTDQKPSAVGREFLMLGMAVYKAASGNQFLANLLFGESGDKSRSKESPGHKLPLNLAIEIVDAEDLPEDFDEAADVKVIGHKSKKS